MLLEKLREYSARIDLTPPMYAEAPIKWLIELDANGRFLSVVKLDGQRGKADRGEYFPTPHIVRSSGVRASGYARAASSTRTANGAQIPANAKAPAKRSSPSIWSCGSDL